MSSVRDVIIIGAGPGGGSAAWHLARLGASVLVLEKQALPRYKPCGGGVGPEVRGWFDIDFTPAVSAYVDAVRYTWNMGERVDAPLELREPLWMVRRDIFDHHLISAAVARGAALRTGETVQAIAREGATWRVTTDQGTHHARLLIGADGAKGQIAKWLGLAKRRVVIGGAIEIEINAPVPEPNVAHFEFGMVANGYLWNFPKKDCHSIGIGAWGQKSVDLRTPLAAYTRYFGLSMEGVKQHGHPLLLWQGNSVLHADGALLCGEAAGIVDPFTAEGIRPSLFTGMCAAEAGMAWLKGDASALAKYSKRVADEHGRDMKWAARVAKAFYAVPRLAYSVGVTRPSATRTMGRLLTGELKWHEVAPRALKRLVSPGALLSS
ncbi:MAG: geranylgeranyl reductase family protein [Gemmatimonadetes bacterium]|nr:geranylgeranyl reductase family protein [Gemmatimonadota bacterium]